MRWLPAIPECRSNLLRDGANEVGLPGALGPIGYADADRFPLAREHPARRMAAPCRPTGGVANPSYARDMVERQHSKSFTFQQRPQCLRREVREVSGQFQPMPVV